MKNLGKTEQSIYLYLKEFIENNSYSPSVREICEALNIKSTSTVHFHLKALERRGLIKAAPNKQRSIQLKTETGSRHTTVEVPLIGTVAAGAPVFAFDDIQEYYPLPRSFLHGSAKESVFMLKVEGESMIDAGILNGDILIVHKDMRVENGDIAVARLNEETATVKRIYYNNGKIRLQPENSSMEPIFANECDVTVIGKVIGVFRKYL